MGELLTTEGRGKIRLEIKREPASFLSPLKTGLSEARSSADGVAVSEGLDAEPRAARAAISVPEFGPSSQLQAGTSGHPAKGNLHRVSKLERGHG